MLESQLAAAQPAIYHYEKWIKNASLEEWFPFSAEEIKSLRYDLFHATAELQEANKHFAGCWYCEKCGFTLQKSVLYVQSGNIGADNSPFNEVCPNDGQLMKPLTLRKAYDDLVAACETQIKRAVEAEDALSRQRANYIELHNAVMGEGCHTSEVHDIFAIARRHREESEIVRRVFGLPDNIALEASLTAYRDDYAALKQLRAARAAEIQD